MFIIASEIKRIPIEQKWYELINNKALHFCWFRSTMMRICCRRKLSFRNSRFHIRASKAGAVLYQWPFRIGSPPVCALPNLIHEIPKYFPPADVPLRVFCRVLQVQYCSDLWHQIKLNLHWKHDTDILLFKRSFLSAGTLLKQLLGNINGDHMH